MHFRHHIVSPIINFKSHWLELIPSVNFFMTCNWDWHVSGPTFGFSIHTSSRDIKSFVRYLHMQRQLHLLPLWECWKEKLRCTIVFSTATLCHTDAAAAADVWAFLLLCGNTNPIIFVNREDAFGSSRIRHSNLNVLCNNPKFSMNHYHWVNSRIWGIHNCSDVCTFCDA